MTPRVVALAAAVLSLTVLAEVRGGGGGPALYDGLCTPPSYALFGSNPAPSPASTFFSGPDLAMTQQLATPPQIAPQAQIIIGSGTLAPAPGATSVALTITAVKPPPLKPVGAIDGNVYDVEATSGGKPVPVAADHPVTIALESTVVGGPTLTMEHFTSGHWIPLKTFQSGCGSTFDAAASSLGLFALVAQGAPGPAGGGSGPSILLIVIAVLAVLLLVIAAVRTSRRRR